jgi:hypothetical protein
MDFLNKNLFETPAWLLNKQLLDVISSPGPDQISAMQDEKLNSLLATSRLQRLITTSNREKESYTMDEFMGDVRGMIWAELKDHKPIDNHRRNLQKSYVEKIIGLTSPRSQMGSGPGITLIIGPFTDPRKTDIVSVAKAQLRIIKDDIKRVLPAYTDNMSRYHLLDISERIEKAMDTRD